VQEAIAQRLRLGSGQVAVQGEPDLLEQVRRGGGDPAIVPEVREAIFAVRQETLHRSRIGLKTKNWMIRQYVTDRFGADIKVPSYATLRRAWQEWFGTSGARMKYQRSAAAFDAAQGKDRSEPARAGCRTGHNRDGRPGA
jgi:hypothetical protein